jgi:hypothetical protein
LSFSFFREACLKLLDYSHRFHSITLTVRIADSPAHLTAPPFDLDSTVYRLRSDFRIGVLVIINQGTFSAETADPDARKDVGASMALPEPHSECGRTSRSLAGINRAPPKRQIARGAP